MKEKMRKEIERIQANRAFDEEFKRKLDNSHLKKCDNCGESLEKGEGRYIRSKGICCDECFNIFVD